MANAAAAALATPPRTATRTAVDLDTVASLTGKTVEELEEMLAERDRQVAEHSRARLCDIPEPWAAGRSSVLVETDPDGPQFDRAEVVSWAQRMGWHPHRGRAVIGYSGMAVLLDLSEQSLRVLSTRRQRHIRQEHKPRLEDIPPALPSTRTVLVPFAALVVVKCPHQEQEQPPKADAPPPPDDVAPLVGDDGTPLDPGPSVVVVHVGDQVRRGTWWDGTVSKINEVTAAVQVRDPRGKFTLFDRDAVIQWAIQTGRLAADGHTPTPLRPATSALRQGR